MPPDVKQTFLDAVHTRFGSVCKLRGSQSLYELNGNARVYIRYSKLHAEGRTFYGLRATDLRELEGRQSLICFLWEGQTEPLLIPFRNFEEVFANLVPASDGQFKVQVYVSEAGSELYIAKAGRFNVESYFGWNETNDISPVEGERWNQQLTHSQVQTLLGSIGVAKGHNIWLPRADRARSDWSLAQPFSITDSALLNRDLAVVASDIDVIWLKAGSNDLAALFEIEHSTPIYSGLLRFNDVRLVMPALQPRFTIVANESRRSRFTSQINRPTFRASRLNEFCTFLDYANVFEWHKRLTGGKAA